MTASQYRPVAKAMLDFIEQSPTPWHAVASTCARLQQAGFTRLLETDSWSLQTHGRYFVTRQDASVIAFIVGEKTEQQGLRIIGAHTDSPGMRVKTSGAQENGGYLRLNCEVYGGPILATFTDRDLALAGRLLIRDSASKDGVRSMLYNSTRAVVRMPNLPIHLNRNVNDDGLKVHKHRDLNLLLSALQQALPARDAFSHWLCQEAGIDRGDLLGFELLPYDAQPGAFFGVDDEFIAVRQLDNLASCHAALEALLNSKAGEATQMIALFDHEEVGSTSYTGADGSFLQDVIERICASESTARDSYRRSLANSWLLSADMAHAWHPSHNDCYDGLHHLKVNQGVALKINSSQRYATDGYGEALFTQLAEKAGVPSQKYVHRADLSCGSTIGPLSASRIGIRTLDVGVPMWAMHSARESGGADDQFHYVKFMEAFLQH